MSSTLLVAFLAFMTLSTAPDVQGLREQVRQRGSVEVLLIREYSPVDLATLVNSAEMIARALVTESNASLWGDQISTDYTVQVLSVSKAGADSCPPEDVGGTTGYAEFSDVIRNHRHPERKAMLEWAGGSFDPQGFSPQLVKFDDPAECSKIAFGAMK